MNLDLAAIGNCIVAALIDRGGRIVWFCYPRLDGDPLFCRLLDGSGEAEDGIGFSDVVLADLDRTHQSYLPNTAIVATVLTGKSGAAVRITDFAPRFKRHGRIFRPAVLMRRIEPLAGSPRITVRIRPRFGYGSIEPTRTRGSNHIRFLSPDSALRLTTDAPISYVAEEVPFVLDSPVDLLLGPDEPLAASLSATMQDFLARTEDYWLEWTRYLAVPFEYQTAVIRSAITLKLCSFEETGAIVAALTTSIPEAPDTGRNWDYRCCWLRDSFFTVHALNRLGATRTMEDFIRYIANLSSLEPSGKLRPVYAIVPRGPMGERTVDSLAGYRGMGPVRVGNKAELQVQNDAYGSVILAAAQMFFDHRLSKMGDETLFRRLESLGENAAAAALRPDNGLWEYRGRQRVHTFSAVMCWVACDRLARIAGALGLGERERRWRRTAEDLRREIAARAWNERIGSFGESLGGSEVDASLLLLQELGFVAASDPRFLGTVAAIERNLKRGEYLLRYSEADDFGVPSTSFTICTFWLVDALVAIGRKDEARDMFERVLARRNHVGLLSEDIDPGTGELWGNLPQTYSLVGLIISAMRVSKSWEEGFWRGA